jgi:hypothetical protein
VPNTVVFLWTSVLLVAGPQPRSAATGQVIAEHALSDLRDFGAARGLSFVAAPESRPSGLPANDAALVDQLEGELEQARTALSTLEESAASARLSRVEAQLLSHPHLPQAGFLMGECLALQAQAAREQQPARARALDLRRLALEGPRAAAFGDASPAAGTVPPIAVTVQGLGEQDELELDGRSWPAPVTQVTLVPGLHHARVWRGGRPIFATFAEVSGEAARLELGVPKLVACSAEDLAAVPRETRAAKLPNSIACAQWAEVREEGGGIGVALCERNHCGAFVHWQRHATAPFTPIAVERPRWPTWTGFAIAGATVVLASGLVLWQAGAFDRGQPTTWQYSGLYPGSAAQGVRF